MKRFLTLAIALLWATNVAADGHNNPHKGQFYISPGAIAYTGPDSSNIGYEDTEVGGALILGYGLSDNWSIEVMGGRVEDAGFDNRYGSGEDQVNLRWLDFVYNLPAKNAWQPFVLVGGGRTEYDMDGVRPDARDNQLNAGVGVYRQLSDHISLRADVRGVTSSKVGGMEPFAFLGITGFIGSPAAPAAPADSDGDGVPNDMDNCPTTPAGRVVDAQGCELDADNDGVVDGADQCPDTPAGVSVDGNGCPLDTDGDGVPDFRDDCPDSEAGAKVNDRGCYIELEEEVTIDMSIEFETNKAELRPDHTSELARAVRFLRQYPNTKAVIEGHTDTDGAASYNQNLSEQRAKAVYDYLVNEAGVDADRLTWAGFGETRPIASNDTAAGKQTNRRVSAVVSGTHKVRQ
jgi:OmpA-OmpF porin, OOP family